MEINAPVPLLADKSFDIVAEVDYKQGDEGVLFSCGFNIGGYVLFVENSKLKFHYNFQAERYFDLEAALPLQEGRHKFAFSFSFVEPGKGFGVMKIDDVEAGERLEFSDTAFLMRVCVGVGRYAGSPVYAGHKGSRNYSQYTGILDRVDIFISKPETMQDELSRLNVARENE